MADSILVREFVDQYAAEMSIKDLYFIYYNRDEVHYETVRLGMNVF